MRPSTRKKAGKRKQAGGRQRRTLDVAIPHPVQVDIAIDHRRRIQFQVLNPSGQTYNSLTVTPYLLCNHIIMAYSATLGAMIFGMVKVHRVRIWFVPVTGVTAQPLAPYVLWENQNQADTVGNGRLVTDVSVGIQPMYVDSATPKDSNAHLWQISQNTGKLCEIGCAGGGVVEIDCSYRLQAGSANGLAAGLIGATIGKVYFRGLDGIGIATSTWPPVCPLGLQV